MATILYFPTTRLLGDIDNLVKPIIDGMISVVYDDDRVIEKIVVQKIEPGVTCSFSAMTAVLRAAQQTPPPVVYIRIDDSLVWRNP